MAPISALKRRFKENPQKSSNEKNLYSHKVSSNTLNDVGCKELGFYNFWSLHTSTDGFLCSYKNKMLSDLVGARKKIPVAIWSRIFARDFLSLNVCHEICCPLASPWWCDYRALAYVCVVWYTTCTKDKNAYPKHNDGNHSSRLTLYGRPSYVMISLTDERTLAWNTANEKYLLIVIALRIISWIHNFTSLGYQLADKSDRWMSFVSPSFYIQDKI